MRCLCPGSRTCPRVPSRCPLAGLWSHGSPWLHVSVGRGSFSEAWYSLNELWILLTRKRDWSLGGKTVPGLDAIIMSLLVSSLSSLLSFLPHPPDILPLTERFPTPSLRSDLELPIGSHRFSTLVKMLVLYKNLATSGFLWNFWLIQENVLLCPLGSKK